MNMNCKSHLYDLEFNDLMQQKYFVNKTKFISDVIKSKARWIAYFRHRNSFKTTHLKSIQLYCDWQPYHDVDFDTLNVNCSEHKQQYCVLFIPLNNIIFKDKREQHTVLDLMKQEIINSVLTYINRHNVNDEKSNEIIKKLRDTSDSLLLEMICHVLYGHFSKKLIFLFDNVDVPFLNSSDSISEYGYKIIFNSFFADPSPNCFKIVMMGNVPPSCFYSLSSFGSSFMVSTCYSYTNVIGMEHFMLDEEDVRGLLKKYDVDDDSVVKTIDELKLVYGGYRFNGYENEMFNCYSIVEYLQSGLELDLKKPIVMWHGFNSRDILHSSDVLEISLAEQVVWTKMLKEGGTIEIDLHLIPKHKDFMKDVRTGSMFLLLGGYLTVDNEKDGITTLRIPNKEVEAIFQERRDKFLPLTDKYMKIYETANRFFNERKYTQFCNELNRISLNCDANTFHCELAYHVFLLMVFTSNSSFKVLDGRETGLGFADLMLVPVLDSRNPILIEIAYTKNTKLIPGLFKQKFNQVKTKLYGLSTFESYEKIDILLLVGCNRSLQCQPHCDQNIPK